MKKLVDDKVILFLLGYKGYKILESLISNGWIEYIHKVVVGTDNDIPNDYAHSIRDLCSRHNVIFVLKNKIHPDDFNTKTGIAIGWRWVIPVLDKDLIVFHDSLLPKYRGFNPLVTALINGDKEIGVTALIAGEEFDSGDIIGQEMVKIQYPITVSKATDIMTKMYIHLLEGLFIKIIDKTYIRVRQRNEEASYSLWRNEEDYQIDWQKASNWIRRFVDAVGDPYLGASTFYGDQQIRVLNVVELEDLEIVNRDPGKILLIKDENPVIVCGKGLVKITKAVYSGSKEPVRFTKLRVRLK